MLFGLDLAKRDISRQRRAVVVEGYTDVMAMHLAGVTTAVASCGTAFGDEHISVLRRYLLDAEVIRGEVVYTFDGDSAGQKAAIKAFESDQKFAANTYVAVAPAGMDPCELRQAKGDEAVRALVENRTPLFAFAITTTLQAVQPGHRGGPGRGHQRHRSAGRRDQGGDAAGRVHPAAGRVARLRARPDPRAGAGVRGHRRARGETLGRSGIGGAARCRSRTGGGHRNGGPPDRRPPVNGARRSGDDHEPPPEPPEPPDDEAATARTTRARPARR